MKISNSGLSIVKHFESLFLDAYVDPVGVWTIGYGHIGSAATEGNVISEAKADDLLRFDLADAEDAVSTFIDTELTQSEFDALVSFTFNVGRGALSKSTLRKKLNTGDRDGASAELPRWNKGTVGGQKIELAGLTRRRKSERHLFGTGEVLFSDGGGVVDPDDADTGALSVAASGEYFEDLSALVRSWNLRHFRPSELLTMGSAHTSKGSNGFSRHSLPPRDLWERLGPTMRGLDTLRSLLNAPIHLLSVYRNEEYNGLVGGVTHSQHVEFRAADFYAKSISGPSHWASALREIRSDGVFSGGIGVYDTFVHIDCRGEDVDF